MTDLKMPTLEKAIDQLGVEIDKHNEKIVYDVGLCYINACGRWVTIDGDLTLEQLKSLVVLCEKYPWMLDE